MLLSLGFFTKAQAATAGSITINYTYDLANGTVISGKATINSGSGFNFSTRKLATGSSATMLLSSSAGNLFATLTSPSGITHLTTFASPLPSVDNGVYIQSTALSPKASYALYDAKNDIYIKFNVTALIPPPKTAAAKGAAPASAPTVVAPSNSLADYLPAPKITGPHTGSTFTNFPRTATISWTSVPTVKAYNLEVDCVSCQAGSAAAHIVYPVGGTTMIIPALPSNGQYQVRVKAVTSQSSSNWSAFTTFTFKTPSQPLPVTDSPASTGGSSSASTAEKPTTPPPPAPPIILTAPVFVSPAANYVFSLGETITFSWQPVPGAVNYHLQVKCATGYGNCGNAGTVIMDTIIAGTSAKSTAFDMYSSYDANIQAIRADGVAGPWGSVGFQGGYTDYSGITSSATEPNIAFNSPNQSELVQGYDSKSAYISSVSDSNIVTASLSANGLSLTAHNYGTAKIAICQRLSGQCNNLIVTVN